MLLCIHRHSAQRIVQCFPALRNSIPTVRICCRSGQARLTPALSGTFHTVGERYYVRAVRGRRQLTRRIERERGASFVGYTPGTRRVVRVVLAPPSQNKELDLGGYKEMNFGTKDHFHNYVVVSLLR